MSETNHRPARSSLRVPAILTAIIIAAVLRLAPHHLNFTPLGAMALFSGAYLKDRPIALAVPVTALFIGDVAAGFDPDPSVYAGFALIVMLGSMTFKRVTAARVIGSSLAGSVIFFLITNFAVWRRSGGYADSVDGLLNCYLAGVPFFRNTIAGDLFYSTIAFGGFEALQSNFPALCGERKAFPY